MLIKSGKRLVHSKLKGFAAACLIAAFATSTGAGAIGGGTHRLLALDGHFVKWGSQTLGTGATVTYALATSRHSYRDARNCRNVAPFDQLSSSTRLPSAKIKRELEAAFAAWSAVADLKFVRIDDVSKADIVIGTQVVPRGRAFANVSPRTSASAPPGHVVKAIAASPADIAAQVRPRDATVAPISKALICFNASNRWKVGFNGDLKSYDLRYTFMHEIGHAIGLDHPGSRNELMDFKYSESFTGLRPGDVAGVRRLYGARRNENGKPGPKSSE